MTFKLFECLQKQEEYGWKFDSIEAENLIQFLDKRIERIDRAISPNLPLVLEVQETKINGEYKYVKEPFLKSGNYNQHVLRYWGADSEVISNRIIGGPYSRVSFRPVDLNSNDETKFITLNDDEIAIIFAGARITLNNSGTIDQIVLQGVNQYANDAAAAAAGIDVGALYVNSGTGAVSQRLV